jgi:biofilm PGA synthesis N-glycosyltransferase PgaC
MAYNEEANIANAIRSVLGQQVSTCEIVELVVVASGCTDGTPDRVLALAREDARVSLIVEETRAGKASAINRFIETARGSVLILVGGDVVVADGTIEALACHFQDPHVGMAGGHPVPVNDKSTFLGHTVHLLWNLHDAIARSFPKAGEIVAFRNVLPAIPTDTAVDEVSLESRITQSGYSIVYEPTAIVYNRGPSTVADFLRQRRRIAAGHFRIAHQEGYAASTMRSSRIARAMLEPGTRGALRRPLWTASAMGLELWARALGYYDFLRKRPHHIWSSVPTTKAAIEPVIVLDAPGSPALAPAPPGAASIAPDLTIVSSPLSGATGVLVIERATAVIERATAAIEQAEAVIVEARAAIEVMKAAIDGVVAPDALPAGPAARLGYVSTAGGGTGATSSEEGTWA